MELADGSIRLAIGLAGDSCTSRPSIDDPDAVLLGTIIDENKDIVVDIAAYECANNTDNRAGPGGIGQDLTSNPFRLLSDYPQTGDLTVLDAGANALQSVNAESEIEVDASRAASEHDRGRRGATSQSKRGREKGMGRA